MFQQRFKNSAADSSLFVLKSATSYILVLVYVDDVIITGSNLHAIQSLISTFNSQFSLKDLGNLSFFFFFRIEVTRGSNSMLLTQSKYTRDLLKKTKMDGVNSYPSSMMASKPLSLTEGDILSCPNQYRSIVGALQYLTITRPDISFVVNKLSQYLRTSTPVH